jgi:hypothetical protein
MKAPYISKEEYSAICSQQDVNQEDIRNELLRWFKDLGILYYYAGDKINFESQELTVLNPSWLTGGIYRLIVRTEEGKGFIKLAKVRQILETVHPNDINPEVSYRGKEIDFVLNVMEQFEIAGKYEDEVFIPLKLPKVTPQSAASFDKESALHLSWEGEYMPYNVIHRLMIKMFGELDKECVWLGGARFNSYDREKTALIQMDMDEKQIHVYVNSTNSNEKKEYLNTIREKINEILKRMELTHEEYIHYNIDDKKGKIQYHAVLKQFHDRISKIYLYETDQYIEPEKLLHYVYADKEIEGMMSMTIINQGNMNIFERDNHGPINFVENGNGNVNVQTGEYINSEVHQEIHNKTEINNWANNLPEKAVSSAQLKEFQAMIEAFMRSDRYKKMTNEETEPLKNVLEDSKKPFQPRQVKWKKLRDFFIRAGKMATTLFTGFTEFIEHYPEVVEWIKQLLRQNS